MRLILQHDLLAVSGRAAALRPGHRLASRLARWLNPGGRLLLGDAVELPDVRDTSSPYRRTMDAVGQALRTTIGTDIPAVPAHPHFLRETGWEDVAAQVFGPLLVAGGPMVRFWSKAWQRIRPELEATCLVDGDTADVAFAYLASPRLAELGPGSAPAWCRPGAGAPEAARRPSTDG